MTAKDYRAIAEAIKWTRENSNLEHDWGVREVMHRIADYCGAENPRGFNRAQFFANCSFDPKWEISNYRRQS